MPGHQIGAATQAVRLIHDDQVPAGAHEVQEPLLVVRRQLLPRPSSARVHRLHRVHGADHLVERAPEVRVSRGVSHQPRTVDPGPRRSPDPAIGIEIARVEQAEGLAEVGAHFRHPLDEQSLGGDNQRALHQSPQLQLTHDEPGFDGLAQPNLIGQQVSHPIAGHRPRQCPDLVRQWNHRGLDGGEENVLRQCIGDSGGGDDVGQSLR